MNKSVLILAYYYPPGADSASMRNMKLIKYLAGYGWDINVMTTKSDSRMISNRNNLSSNNNIDIIRTRYLEVDKIPVKIRDNLMLMKGKKEKVNDKKTDSMLRFVQMSDDSNNKLFRSTFL